MSARIETTVTATDLRFIAASPLSKCYIRRNRTTSGARRDRWKWPERLNTLRYYKYRLTGIYDPRWLVDHPGAHLVRVPNTLHRLLLLRQWTVEMLATVFTSS